jgi:peptidoglycan hydrolase CwlO-like protein
MKGTKMDKLIKINLGRASSLLGKDYEKGIQEVPESIKKDPMYALLVKDKMVQEVVDSVKADEYTAELESELKRTIDEIRILRAKIEGLNEIITSLDAEKADDTKEITKLKAEIKKLKK